MTQPVQEPSDPRSLAGLDYRIRQLARRPPVIAAGNPIPWVRLKQVNLEQAWTANDEQIVTWDDVCYSTFPDGTDYFAVSDFNPGDNAVVSPLIGGLFQTTAFVVVDPSVAGGKPGYPDSGFIMILDGMYFDQHEVFIAGGTSPATNGIPVNDTGTGYIELTFRAEDNNTMSDFPNWDVQIHSLADAMRLIGHVSTCSYWEVRYLGAADVPLGLDSAIECSGT